MRHRVLIFAVPAFAVAAVVALPGMASKSLARTYKTIVLYENQKTTKVSVVDEPPTSKSGALSVGDEYLFYTPLYDKKRMRLGTAYGKATVVVATKNPDHARFVNDIVIDLGDGTIDAHGLFVGGRLNSYGITGGTGAYEGARGTFRETKDGDILKLIAS